MNGQRTLGFALIALQAAALAYCFHTTVFSAGVVVAALAGWLTQTRPVSADGVKRVGLALVVLYIVQRSVVPPGWHSSVPSFVFSDSSLIAHYFLAFQVVQFFVRREPDRLPSYLPILAVVTMSFTGDFRANDQARLIFQVFSVTLIALTAAYFAACRVHGVGQTSKGPAGRTILLGIVLLGSAGLAWGSASNLYRYSRQIEVLLGIAMSPPPDSESAGFSGQGRVGSVARQKADAGSSVALRIYADDPPGYLRGRAFDTYGQSEWHADGERSTLLPDPDDGSRLDPQRRLGELRTFSLARIDTDACRRLEIWPNRAFEEVVFVPPALVALELPVDQLSIDVHGIVEADELPGNAAYRAWVPKDPLRCLEMAHDRDRSDDTTNWYVQSFRSTDWAHLTALPDDLDPRILALAKRVVAGAATAGDKIAAVERYFHENYEYQFGIAIPPGRDPLTYFLLEKPPAHCEYFASGAAVLLRAAGVPTRYVTGFVAAERNDFGDYWIARNRDAHAWVEAFDPERGWVVVEPTPAGGVPQETEAAAASQLWDSFRAWWQRIIASIRNEGLRALLGMAASWLMRPWFLGVVLLAAGAMAWFRLRHRFRRTSARPRNPNLDRLQRLLNEMDRRWRKAGIARQPHETLHQFAERLASATSEPGSSQAAEWYRQCAAIRFGGGVDAASVGTLEERMGCPT